MDPKFETLEAFSILGCPQYANSDELCPSLAWDRLAALREKYGLKGFPEPAFGVEMYPPDFPGKNSFFYYMAGMVLEDSPLKLREHLFIKEIPAVTYAVFPVEDNRIDNIKNTYEYACQSWLPDSEYQFSHRFNLERYREDPEACVEIMLPVVKNRSKGEFL